jgi:hypothetical protein
MDLRAPMDFGAMKDLERDQVDDEEIAGIAPRGLVTRRELGDCSDDLC